MSKLKLFVVSLAVIGLIGCVTLQSPIKIKTKADTTVTASVEAEGTVGGSE